MRKPALTLFCVAVSSIYALWLLHIETYTVDYNVEGRIDQCCCEGSLIKTTNTRIRPILRNLSNSEFFKYFRVNLENECPFWAVDLICTSPKKCGVCKCDDNQIPLPWRQQEQQTDKVSYVSERYSEHEPEDGLIESRWHVEEAENSDGVYVDLTVNPEEYTGFQGQRIWNIIYEENCFHGKDENMCLEERMLYKIISGLHSSINTQLSWYFIDHDNDYKRFPNTPMFFGKVGNHPDRIRNLYFAYSVVLRAINLASEYIRTFEYNTGRFEDDIKTEKNIHDLLNETLSMCSQPFDESEIFQNITNENVKRQFIRYFHNISRIMDCVECEKCKVYGKMQTYGIATALKILFNEKLFGQKSISLKRNELIALVNTFMKLSSSVELVDSFYQKRYENTKGFAHTIAVCAFLLVLFGWIAVKAHKESKLRRKGHVKPSKVKAKAE